MVVAIDADALLARHEGEPRAELQQEGLELPDDRIFEVLLEVPVLETEETQQVWIAEDQVRRQLVVGAQGIELCADELSRFSRQRCSLVEHPLDLLVERPRIPPLDAA